MRKLCAALAVCVLSVPAFAGETPIVRFDAAGVSVDGKPVDSAALELRSAGEGALLASTRCVESISGSLSVELAPGRQLTVEPGVRLERTADGFRLSNAAGRKIRLTGPEGEISNAVTVDFAVNAEGWTVAGLPLKAASLEAALPQDDADSSLGRMRRASQRTTGRTASKKSRRVFSNGDPGAMNEAVDRQAIRLLLQVSPDGSP